MYPVPKYFQNDWYTFGVFFILICFSLIVAELIKKNFHVPTKLMRKIVHVGVGVMVLASPFIFTSNIPPIILAAFFFCLNFFAIKYNLLQSIHGTERVSYGTVYFPMTFMILSYFYWDQPVIFISAMCILTFSDTLAASIGQTSSNKLDIWHDEKSLRGMGTMFISSFIFVAFVLFLFHGNLFTLPEILIIAMITGVGATVGEAVSSRGSDNLSAPLTTALLLDLAMSLPAETIFNLLVWTIASLVIFMYLVKYKVLKLNGMLTAYLMGIIIFGIGGSSWIIPVLTFFLTSSLLSKISPAHKTNISKSSQRDMFQVLANGGIPLLVAVMYFYTGISWLYLVYLAGIAAATGDTWATEIGGFSRKDPRHILTFKPVSKGTSGGVSIIGTTGAMLGAALISFTGYMFGLNIFSLVIITFSGFTGSIIDSILGATAQSRFICGTCSKTTEKKVHCTLPATHLDGLLWIDNDMVNFLNTASSSIILYIILFAV